MKPIFIIAQHRTGSTLLKNILGANSKVVMAFDEMNIFEPFRNNSLDKLVGKTINTPVDLIKSIENKEIYGTFWKEFDASEIDKDKFFNGLKKERDFNVKAIIRQVLLTLQGADQTIHTGVKYPVHFGKLNVLKEWFPHSKIVFLIRNPKATIASKLNDPSTKKRKKKSLLHSFFVHYFTLFYFCFEFKKLIKVYLDNQKEIFKITYEELVLEQKHKITKLCDYCEIEFEQQMLDVTGKDSSYKTDLNVKNMLSNLSVEKYKKELSNFDILLINILTINAYNLIKK
jgi:hypothetical protein